MQLRNTHGKLMYDRKGDPVMGQPVITLENWEAYTGIHPTLNHTGKMEGMASLSTSCQLNPYCRSRAENPELVCSHCYAQRQMKMYKNMNPLLKRNTEILTSRLLEDEEIPIINRRFFRFESFGDLVNETQCLNYFRICKKNPKVHFALWTKNIWIVEEAIKTETKPKNLQVVLSSYKLNQQGNTYWFPYVDKIFTVFTKEYIKANNISINCGAANCLKCQKCYLPGERFINEKLK